MVLAEGGSLGHALTLEIAAADNTSLPGHGTHFTTFLQKQGLQTSLFWHRHTEMPLTCCRPAMSPPGPARPRGAAQGRSPRGGWRAPAWLGLW